MTVFIIIVAIVIVLCTLAAIYIWFRKHHDNQFDVEDEMEGAGSCKFWQSSIWAELLPKLTIPTNGLSRMTETVAPRYREEYYRKYIASNPALQFTIKLVKRGNGKQAIHVHSNRLCMMLNLYAIDYNGAVFVKLGTLTKTCTSDKLWPIAEFKYHLDSEFGKQTGRKYFHDTVYFYYFKPTNGSDLTLRGAALFDAAERLGHIEVITELMYNSPVDDTSTQVIGFSDGHEQIRNLLETNTPIFSGPGAEFFTLTDEGTHEIIQYPTDIADTLQVMHKHILDIYTSSLYDDLRLDFYGTYDLNSDCITTFTSHNTSSAHIINNHDVINAAIDKMISTIDVKVNTASHVIECVKEYPQFGTYYVNFDMNAHICKNVAYVVHHDSDSSSS